MPTTVTRVDSETLGEIINEMAIRQTKSLILVFCNGSQTDGLIRMAVARQGVYCLFANPKTVTVEEIGKLLPMLKGIILSGGQSSVYADPPPSFDYRILDLGIPILGICLGMQMIGKHLGATVQPGQGQYGRETINLITESVLFDDVPEDFIAVQNHGDRVLPNGQFEVMAICGDCVAAINHRHIFGVQFHPEVREGEYGDVIFENFLGKICHITDNYPAENVAAQKVAELKAKLGSDKKVLILYSGGNDSTVTLALLGEAVDHQPGRVRALYIKGVDRPDDEAHARRFVELNPWCELKVVDATEQFLVALAGLTEMPAKRDAMIGVYHDLTQDEINDPVFKPDFVGQGTLYTDLSETGHQQDGKGEQKATIKRHHNVGHNWSVPELCPLADQVKDSARNIGEALGVPAEFLWRHPFPGPGLIVRIGGEVTCEKLAMARALDRILIEELRTNEYKDILLYDIAWQAGVDVLQDMHTCQKGDGAASGNIVMWWAIISTDGFTAREAMEEDGFTSKFKLHLAQLFINEVKGVGAVAERQSGKPPSTIEMG